MPIILTDERIRIPAREKLKRQTPYDVKFISLTLLAVIVFFTSTLYPAAQDFQSFHELFYNIDIMARYSYGGLLDNGSFEQISNTTNANIFYQQLSNLIITQNTTCLHSENFLQPSFINHTLNQDFDIDDVYTSVDLTTFQLQPGSSEGIIGFDPMFHYSCVASRQHVDPSLNQENSSTSQNKPLNSLTKATLQTALQDVTNNLAILYDSNIVTRKQQLPNRTSQSKKSKTTKNGESIIPQRPSPPRQNTIVPFNLNIVCHHRLFCGLFNELLTWSALRSYIYLQYLNDLTQALITINPKPTHTEPQDVDKSMTFTLNTKTFTNLKFELFDWSLFGCNAIIYPFAIMYKISSALGTMMYQIVTDYQTFSANLNIILSTLEPRHELTNIIIALRANPFTTRSYRIDTIFDTLSTLHHIISLNINNQQ
jgi:hypothetical protein